MKLFTKILTGLAALVLLVLIAGLLLPNTYSVKRAITIQKSNKEVFAYLKHLKNQNHYSKWAMTDPHMEKGYPGQDGTSGFVFAWNSQEVGKGEQEIRQILENEQIDTEIRFEKPFESVALTHFTTNALAQNQTRVEWEMEGSSPYPLNVMSILMQPMIGSDLETSLTTLKSNLEKP